MDYKKREGGGEAEEEEKRCDHARSLLICDCIFSDTRMVNRMLLWGF